ncbi:glutathione peroxidase [Orenia metallireducens]|uniref:Glutathione peroxidase n=1 Tax=Orenia metallireducens TaxID=1413210 RepID=A0A285HIL4_9FIRM|nr:glutathione peroxidase [Orenia metallireducens]PRX27223.1 glutathione peroxidase [Orenia metallireducens]SNY35463.1 glutathione peroxidase [Orenia metallireducens]
MSIYDFKVKAVDGKEVSLEEYKGKVLIIANTASKCGFTPQYEDLQKLYEEYKDQGLEILGFPCNQFANQEPGTSQEAQSFCTMNYGVEFPIFAKVDVRGEGAIPLFKYLTEKAPHEGFDLDHPNSKLIYSVLSDKFPSYIHGNSIKWNFTKFVVGRDGEVLKRFETHIEPRYMEEYIQEVL